MRSCRPPLALVGLDLVLADLIEGDKRSAAESMSRAPLSASAPHDGSQVGTQGLCSEPAGGSERGCDLTRSEGFEPPAF
jgi:hypothetical protein